MLDNDFSSKLCFEEKLSILSFCNKCNVIFKVFSVVKFFKHNPSHLCQDPMPSIPAKNRQEIHHQSKNHKGNKNIVHLKSVKIQTLESGFFQIKNQSLSYIRYFWCFKQSICKKSHQRAKRNCGRAKQVFGRPNCW